MNKPIMLWMTSRSRSSMVSAIFARHNIFWGDKQVQSAGYDTYENQDIKALQRKYKNSWWQGRNQPINAKDAVYLKFQEELQKIVPNNIRWSMKTGVEYFPAYEKLNPYNIFIKRNPEDVAKSLCEKRSESSYDEALEIILWRYEYMDNIQKEHGGIVVNTDKIILGDLTEIEKAMEYCEIDYNKTEAKLAIKK